MGATPTSGGAIVYVYIKRTYTAKHYSRRRERERESSRCANCGLLLFRRRRRLPLWRKPLVKLKPRAARLPRPSPFLSLPTQHTHTLEKLTPSSLITWAGAQRSPPAAAQQQLETYIYIYIIEYYSRYILSRRRVRVCVLLHNRQNTFSFSPLSP